MIPRLNFHHLFYFYTVATHGSVSRAAKELRLSQPALSAQIKQLESVLNIKLFEKKGRLLVLTEEGHSALSYAKAIFDTGREFLDSLQDRASSGRIRIQIGVTNSVPKAVAAAFLAFILEQEKNAHIVLVEDTLPVMAGALNNHALDVVLSDVPFHGSGEEGIRNHLAAKIPVGFYTSSLNAARYKNFPRSLHGAPVILPTSHSHIFQAAQEYFTAAKISPRIIAEIQDAELVLRMAFAGAGIAPLNTYSVMNSSFKNKLVRLGNPSGAPGIFDPVYLLFKSRIKPHPLQEKILSKFKLESRA